MTITFVRSGGFAAAPGLRVSATITLDHGEAGVTAAPSYWRPLGDEERQQIADAVSALLEGGQPVREEDVRSRDAYQFAFTLKDQGRQLVVSATGGSETLPPTLRILVEWAGREAAAIALQRVNR